MTDVFAYAELDEILRGAGRTGAIGMSAIDGLIAAPPAKSSASPVRREPRHPYRRGRFLDDRVFPPRSSTRKPRPPPAGVFFCCR